MPDSVLSRRGFLAAASLGTGAVLLGCDLSSLSVTATPTPDHSPALPGPYQTSRVILGEGFSFAPFPALQPDATFLPGAPSPVPAAVYFPTDKAISSPVAFTGHLPLPSGQFPILLYAHAFRQDNTSGDPSLRDTPPSNRDFTTVEVMLSHVASYGCVCLAPDFSWLGDMNWDTRGHVFVAYLQFLAASLNQQLFNNQIQLDRVILVGHSTGAGGATHAGRDLMSVHGVTPLAYGLIAPEDGGDSGPDIRNLVVLGGTLDPGDVLGANPFLAFTAGGQPKTWVTIPGANHFGYTDVCPATNQCALRNVDDTNATISRAAQQQTAAAYLAAMVRYYALGEGPVRGYLSGERAIEGLPVSGVQVQAQGLPTSPPTPIPTSTATPARPTIGPNQ